MLILKVSVKSMMMVTLRFSENGLPMIGFGRICGLTTLRKFSDKLEN